ncbi:MAG: hypothetical protein GXP23_05255 [Gammaproteobacteria bacterium]|nr:hypothetical protein [Gammaproteobacteria bacterium]
MRKNNKKSDRTHLSEAIRSLQNLLDDVSTEIIDTADDAVIETTSDERFEETTEFTPEETSEVKPVPTEQVLVDIDSHFDMNIPPALPDEDEEIDDVIPTLSETIVEGEIPVLKEIVKLPDGSTIPEPDPNITLEMAIHSGTLPTPISDAAEAAADAVQIILARYRGKPLTSEVREEIKSAVAELLSNSPELEIPDSIV